MVQHARAGRGALIEQLSVSCIALVAGTAVGSSDDTVLRWITAGITLVGPSYITFPDSVTLGTLFTINTPGVYRCEMMLPQLASTTLLAGIAKGTTTGVFTGNPVIGVNGVVATAGPNTLPAATTIGLYLGKDIPIGDGDLDGTNNVIRFLASDGAGGTPEPALTEAGCWATITRIADQAA